MDNDYGIFTLIVIALLFTHVASYQVGKRLEAKTWRKAIAEDAAEFCDRCYDLGYKNGYFTSSLK
jgi:hypothetical protein